MIIFHLHRSTWQFLCNRFIKTFGLPSVLQFLSNIRIECLYVVLTVHYKKKKKFYFEVQMKNLEGTCDFKKVADTVKLYCIM